MSVHHGNRTRPNMNSKQHRVNMENYIHSKLVCNSQIFFTRYLYKVFKMN